MPIYEYACPKEHHFDLKQSFTADTVAICPTCGGKAKRVLHVPAVVYKGSGFYTTDYARKGTDSSPSPSDKKSDTKGEKKDAATSEKKSDKSEKSEAKAEKKTETKAETKSSSKESTTDAAK